MLSIGWTEMLVIAAFALIVVGPRDLPNLLRQVGRAVGMMRRMSNEFRAEINKVTALDEVRDIRKSITDPIKKTRSEIEREFNAITPTGVEPTGAIKPAEEGKESVFDEIKGAAGMAGGKAENQTAGAAAARAGRRAKSTAKRSSEAKPASSGSRKAGSAKPVRSGAGKSAAASRSGKASAAGKTGSASVKAAGNSGASPRASKASATKRQPAKTGARKNDKAAPAASAEKD